MRGAVDCRASMAYSSAPSCSGRQANVCAAPSGTRQRMQSAAAALPQVLSTGASGQLLPHTVRQRVVLARAAESKKEEIVPDTSYAFVSQNQDTLRALPLYAGGLGVVALLANRALSGIAPVVDASSSQSRADVLGIALSAVLMLTGLQWLSLKPRVVPAVDLEADQADFIHPDLKTRKALIAEAAWARDTMLSVTRCKSLVLIYNSRTLFFFGAARKDFNPAAAQPGEICTRAMKDGRGDYLANLVLYPGRPEFTAFLPENTQGVMVQPIGSDGVLVAGTDTVRGFSRVDQSWLASIADKLEVTLQEGGPLPQSGLGFAAAAGGGAKSGGRK